VGDEGLDPRPVGRERSCALPQGQKSEWLWATTPPNGEGAGTGERGSTTAAGAEAHGEPRRFRLETGTLIKYLGW